LAKCDQEVLKNLLKTGGLKCTGISEKQGEFTREQEKDCDADSSVPHVTKY